MIKEQVIRFAGLSSFVKHYLYFPLQRLSRKPALVGEHVNYLGEFVKARQQIQLTSLPDKMVMHPRLGERFATTPFDRHYFYQDTWALRRILQNKPRLHVDIGSRVIFAGFLSQLLPVGFVDIRPLNAKLPNLICSAGSLLNLPFRDEELSSVSCLHVAEHVGLGRYGDPLDVVNGTKRACAELQRILRPGGRLYFSLPVGGENRIEFNAHRVHTVGRIREYFSELDMLELSGVTDEGSYVEGIAESLLNQQYYGCGMFVFTRLL